MKRNSEHFRGCLIGGAIGDAMGWPVEFLKLEDIKVKYGENGISELVLKDNGKAEITDDTQMTLFTAEGLLRSETIKRKSNLSDISVSLYYAYQRWLSTQGYPMKASMRNKYNGWLIKTKELYKRRAPGISCLTALDSEKIGTINDPINNSKGCGGVMRVAPIGLFYPKDKAFEIAMNCAAITHGHPMGYLSAGVFAYIIAAIIEGQDIEVAVNQALIELSKYKSHKKCTNIAKKAIELSKCSLETTKAISELGEGWIGEEALAISIYCALKYRDNFKKAILVAVNHDGDSDSTGAITGNILGAYLGIGGIPKLWMNKAEIIDLITEISDDLLIGYKEDEEWLNKYPVY